MQDFQNQLEQAGLSKREAALYVALLQSGPSSIVTIAKKADMKRPTVYLVLDELVRKGLVSLVPKEKRKLFVALSPERIVETLDERSRSLRAVLPQMMQWFKNQSEQPKIQILESTDGMLNVYREITASKKEQEILTFFSFDVIGPEFEEMWNMFLTMIKKNSHIRERDLFSGEYKNQSWIPKAQRLPNYQIRQAPKEFPFFSDTVIYGNKVALISYKKRFAIIIESEDIANSFRSVFELAWQSARAL